MGLNRFAKEFLVIMPLLLTSTSSIPDKVCKGGQVDSSNIDSFKDCTIIDGSLVIENVTFTGNMTISKMDPSELEVFSTVKEITGLLSVTASHPDFADLHYFRNLQMIGEMEGLSGVYIAGTSLKSFGLRSLKRISGVIFIYENNNLCFTEGINWHKLQSNLDSGVGTSWLESLNNPDIFFENNRPEDACLADNMVCHERCWKEDGCWGPGVDECLSCKRFSLEGTRVDSCSYPGVYQSGDKTCAKCHERCKNCTGDGFLVSVCNECYHFRSEEQHEDLCLIKYYTGYATIRCIRCSPGCKRCMGPRWDQCESCRHFKVPLGGNANHKFICSDKCTKDKPRIRQDQGGPYCSDDPGEATNTPDIVGRVVAMFVIGISAAAYCYQCWQRTCLRGNTVKMTMPLQEMAQEEQSDPLNTPPVDPNHAKLAIDKEAEPCNESIPDAMCATDEQVDKADGTVVNLEKPCKEEGPCTSSPLLQQDESIVSKDLTVDCQQGTDPSCLGYIPSTTRLGLSRLISLGNAKGNSKECPQPQFMAAKLSNHQLDESDMWSLSEYLDNENWIRIGWNLQIAKARLNELKTKYGPNNRECAVQMLRFWRESNLESTLQDLFDALRKLRMKSTIKQIKKIDFSEYTTQK